MLNESSVGECSGDTILRMKIETTVMIPETEMGRGEEETRIATAFSSISQRTTTTKKP